MALQPQCCCRSTTTFLTLFLLFLLFTTIRSMILRNPPLSPLPPPPSHPVIVDTDVGFDDLFALTLLLSSPLLAPRLTLITTVRGMSHPSVGARTVRRLLKKFGREKDVKVIPGASEPTEGGHTLEESAWGRRFVEEYARNVDRLGLPESNEKDDDNENGWERAGSKERAANALAEALSPSEGVNAATLLCLGPLTNVAAALSSLSSSSPSSSPPPSPPFLRDLVLMGGAIDVQGNAGPDDLAELNFYSDPRAAHAVLVSGAGGDSFRSIRMADLKTANEKPCERVKQSLWSTKGEGDGVGELLRGLIGVEGSAAGYDPVTASFLLDETVLSTEEVKVSVDGATGVSSRVVMEKDEGGTGVVVTLATRLDVDAYVRMVEEIVRVSEECE